MRLLKIVLIPLVLVMLAVPLSGCGSESDEAELAENQIATVQRGDLRVDISAAGNLALSHTEDLAIELFYGQSGASGTKGTIGEVLVEEGDTVEEGQALVTIDEAEWDDELSALEDQVTTEERALTQAQVNLLTADQNLKNARDNEATKELALLNAQISLETAKDNLSDTIETYGWAEFDPIDAELNAAKSWLDRVVRRQSEISTDTDDSLTVIDRAQDRLYAAQAAYDNFLAGHGNEKIDLKEKQVDAAELSLTGAQEDLADIAQDVSLKELQLTLTQGKVTDAEKALEDAREDLAEAQSKSPEITAPFDGFITTINVEGGDEVLNGTVAVQLADPGKFEADILVSEIDILQLKLGGEAWVEVDAMSGMSLPATVTHISPTATIQSGVVNYEVKVEIQSLEAVVQERQEVRQRAMADIAAGELPPPLQQAIDEGRLTREQVEEMIKQRQAEMGGAGAEQIPQASAPVPEDFQLREGLTVTVSIIIEEKTDVLLVPNAAITSEGGQSYVQVVSESGGEEKRAIQTGTTDYQFTEVTDGLDEGEQVLVPQGTATTSTASNSGPRPGGLMMFGGPPRR
ncbi:efflux RND transporter periplasmic adaptor subunit [Chloroflexota bacterium]